MKNNRIEWIDFLRGVVILLVVIGHINSGLMGSESFQTHEEILSYLHNFFRSFRMPIFFVISGFLYATKINHSFGELKNSLKKKLIALGIPYIVFSVLIWWLKYFMGDNVNRILTWSDLYLLPIRPFGRFWFLYVLFLIYAIVEILDYIFKNNFIVFIILLCATICGWYFCSDIFIVDKTLSMILYFYLAKLMRINIDFVKSKVFIALGILTFIILQIIGIDNSHKGIDFVVAISISLSAIVLCSRIKNENKIFKYFSLIGKSTLPIFLLNPSIASAVRIFLLKIGINNLFLHYTIGIVITWYFSIFIYHLASKNKYTDFLFYPLRYVKIETNN